MKVQSLHLSIPQPCHEDWDKMTPTEKGRHCQSCQKEVVDFTAMSDQQILDLFSKNKNGLCGRFRTDQLDRQMLLRTTTSSTPWAKAGMLAASLLLAVPVLGQQQTGVKTEQLVKDLVTPNSRLKQSINGTVTDEMGEPLIAASILIKGTNKGTITDLDGRFQLDGVVKNDTVVVSYVGYKSKEISLSTVDRKFFNISLKEGIMLQEAVVTAYGTCVKGAVGGAISVIRSVRSRRVKKWTADPKTEIRVFPNPFVSQIQIELGTLKEGDYNLRLVSSTGQIVHQLQLFLSSHQRLEMDLAALNLPSGSYWLQITDGKGQDFRQQVIKINR